MRNTLVSLSVGLATQLLLAVPARAQDVFPPVIDRLTPAVNAVVARLTEVEVVFSEAVSGVDASDLRINGLPATGMDFGGVGVFRFRFPQPPDGPVLVEFAADHGITDEASPANAFVAPPPWAYTLNSGLALYSVRINEFLADNQTGKRDEDGTYQDWIELYNPGPQAVDIGGCYLTDNPLNLTKWRFPTFPMPPNTYLLVWASEKNRTNALAPLHTNFKLDKDGEFLALVDPSGTNFISSFGSKYPKQSTDVSYGSDPADPNIRGYFSKPTPGAANQVPGAGLAPPVKFSVPGGTFINPFTVAIELDPPNPNAVIRYVLATNIATASATVTNVPGTNSPIYTAPIPILQTTQLRVRVFEPDKLPSEPVSVNYIQIAAEVAQFSSDVPIVIVHNFGQGSFGGIQTDRSAIVATFHADLDRASVTNTPDLMTRAAANDRGSSTANQPKVNMAIEFWDEFNQDADRPFVGMPAESDWVLYGINGFDPGMMHNAIFHWMGRKVGPYSSRTRYVEVFLKTTGGPITLADYNGVYLVEEKPKRNRNRIDIESLQPENTNAPSVTGGYVLRVDRVDSDERTFALPDIWVTNLFVNGLPVTNSYGTGPGDPVIVDYPLSLDWGTNVLRAPQRFYIQDYFTNFLRALTSPNFTDPVLGYRAYIEEDSWINNHIANTICFNVDGYRLSGYLYKDRNKKLEQGPPWDCDRCLGTGGTGNTPQGDDRCFNPRQFRIEVTGHPGNDPDRGTDFFGTANGTGVDWWDRMFRDPDFWQRWIDRYQQFRTNEFSNQEILAMVDGFYNELKESQVREQRRWSGTFTYPRWGVQTQQGYTFDFGPPDPQFTSPAKGGYFTNEVNFQKRWLLDRLDFLDTNFLAMPLLTNGTSAVSNGTLITVRAAAKAGTLILYTLDGTDPRLPGGGISPAARTNAGNLTLTITSNTWLFARCYNPNHFNLTNRYVSSTSYEVGKPHISSPWSGPVSASFYTSVPPLRITEIMYHPDNPPAGNTNDADNFEYIEVRNIGITPLNVNRFRLSGGVDFAFPNAVLAGGEHAVIVRDVAAFQSRYGTGPRVLGRYTNNLANDGDRLVLAGGQGEPIHDFSYDDAWYPITDGPGFSLQIVNDNAPLRTVLVPGQAPVDTWGLKGSWRASGIVRGTPASADPGPPAIASVYVNEVMSNTDPSPSDAIEVYNPGVAAVNIGGWSLTDSFGTPKKFRIPAGTMVPGNGYLVFYQSNSFGVDANSFSGSDGFALNAKGDQVYLFSADAAGNLTGWYHGFDFGAQFPGATFGRHVISTGADQFPSETQPTLGAANAGPKVGPVVISEINYHPPVLVYPFTTVNNTSDEYIELHNLSAGAVPLYDPLHPANTWQLQDAVNYSFPPGTTLAGGEYVLVVGFDPNDASASERFRAVNRVPSGTRIFGPWAGQLDNVEDSVELARPDVPDPIGTPTAGFVPYVLVERVKYQNTAPWPDGANGVGASISRNNEGAYGNDPANWRAVVKTPGAFTPPGSAMPVILVQPANTVGVETKSVTLSITVSGSPPFGYQWTFNDVPIPTGVNSELTLDNLQVSQAGRYACRVFNPVGTTVSSNATLVVRKIPTIVSHPASVVVRVKPDPAAAPTTNATFSVAATSEYPPLRYQWQFNGQAIAGANASSYTVVNVNTNHFGNYACAVTDEVGTRVSRGATLYPVIGIGFLLQPITNQFVAPGSLVGMSCVVTGFPPPFHFQWRRESTPLTNFVSTNAYNVFTLVATNLPFVTNRYRVVVTNLSNVLPGIPSGFSIVITMPDTDGDGLIDLLEDATPGFDKNNPNDALADTDGDGMNNGEELRAGTDPNDRTSNLKADTSSVPGAVIVRFTAKANRPYTVEFRDNAESGAWRWLADVPSLPTDRAIAITDPTGNADRYYRIATPGSRP